LAEKEAEEEELAEDNQPVTSDEAIREGRAGAKTGKRHNRTRTGAQSPARAGQGRQEDPQKRR
jgi:hypothetical protein